MEYAKSEEIKTLLKNYKKYHVGESYSVNRSNYFQRKPSMRKKSSTSSRPSSRSQQRRNQPMEKRRTRKISPISTPSSTREKELLREVESLKTLLAEKRLEIESEKEKVKREKQRKQAVEKKQEEMVKKVEDEKRKNEQEKKRFRNMLKKVEGEKEKNERRVVKYRQKLVEEKNRSEAKLKKEKEKNERQAEEYRQRFILERKTSSEMQGAIKVFRTKLEEERKLRKLMEERLNISKEVEKRVTRLDTKMQEITNEEFWSYNPTKYASLNTGKLEFHHNIYEFPNFICRFMRERSKFQNEESYEEIRLACQYFENVVVCLTKDRVLKSFVEKVKKKYRSGIRSEMTKKESNPSRALVEVVQNLIMEVCRFFFPPEYCGPNSKPKPNIEVIRQHIKESQERRGGNHCFLGDLKQKFGVCRHHSTLFKLVCDSLGILCKMECIEEFHAWNLIQLKEDFYFVDLTNFQNRLFGVSEYFHMLESSLERLNVSPNQENLIRKLVDSKKLERNRILKLREYVQSPQSNFEEVFVSPVQKGGFGDVMLLNIRKDVLKVFKKDEVIAVKKIVVKKEEDEDEGEVDSTSENGTDGIPRRYAIREANHMKILDHPSIIEVIGHWEVEDESDVGHVYIAMNGMDQDGRGFLRTLKKKKNNTMTKIQKQTEVIFFLIETARGLRYLSSMKIVHLDLKLENVMIRWDSQKNEILDVRIIDFGGAKNNDILTSNFMTTEGYDSPEIIDIKTMKSIREIIQEIKKEMEDSYVNRVTIQNLVNNASSKFQLLSQPVHVKNLKEEFDFLCKSCEDLRIRLNQEMKRDLEKKISIQTYLEEVSPSAATTTSTTTPLFDCRADIYSFGVMMGEFLREGFLPQEMRYSNIQIMDVSF